MTYVGADKLGFCWDVNANGTWSTLSNWRRFESLIDMPFVGGSVSGAGAFPGRQYA